MRAQTKLSISHKHQALLLMEVVVQEVPIYGARFMMLPATAARYNPIDPATITSPTSATTTVTGLIQGVWYYQIAVTTGGTTKRDTVVVRVDYDVPPRGDIFTGIANGVKKRDGYDKYEIQYIA